MVEDEVESGEVKGPPSLSSIEFLGLHEVLEVFVIRPNLKGLTCALQEVSPLFQGPNDGQKLLVMDLIVTLHCTQGL